MTEQQQSLQLLREIILSRPWMRVLLLTLSFFATLFGLLGPFFQKEFVDTLTHHPLIYDFNLPPLAYLFFSFMCILLSLSLIQIVNWLGGREAIHMQRLLAQRLYKKTLEVRSDTLAGRPLGEIVSVYTTDIPGATILLEQSLPQGTGIFFPLILAPLALIFLFQVPFTNTLLLIGALVLLSLFLAYRQSRFFVSFKQLAADRIGLVSEWIQNIRTLRILGWVPAFEEKIKNVRKVETRNRISMLNNGQSMNAISSSATFLLNLTAVSALVASHEGPVSAGTLLALLWIVAVFLTRPFRMLPWFFTFVFDSWTSIRRVVKVLSLENSGTQNQRREFQKLHAFSKPHPALQIRNLNLSIQGNKLLNQIDLTVQQGEFLAIVGEVGSGKTLLLLSLIGETGANFDRYLIGQNDALTMAQEQLRQFFTFVPQEGFIMSATLRENIAFDYEIDQSQDLQINQSLLRAQFHWKRERMRAGLDTEIGERGVNLSGGQKQRVSLARVDFHNSPIVLLDDCLSAVDVDTENKLVDQLLTGAWKSQTRILVTHRLSVLDKVDRILFLENGQISAEGSFVELMNQSPAFREYAASLKKEVAHV